MKMRRVITMSKVIYANSEYEIIKEDEENLYTTDGICFPKTSVLLETNKETWEARVQKEIEDYKAEMVKREKIEKEEQIKIKEIK
jgi:hypothetical protein